ncbi:ensconsin isoform X2 [Chrysoperla carnea]|uniref:ensconsin isoform X2 n=1 Tax=Chrysoperla carnea TaxID=189513 RepID=UPI001D061A3B|nr:ensconsin isoform X2 [Chrysoperla carnea]
MAENSYSVNLNDKEQNENTTDQHITNRPSSVNKVNTLHWFAYIGPELPDIYPQDRDDRLRQVRDRQNEERLRKLNEIKQQALQAQKIREQKEEERRRRIEEMRARDQDRRALVEERKKQIEDVERDRREYILRKNQEREERLKSKQRNERCSPVFAFGSSTPRMLEPADTGGSSFWTNRRATSTTNMMFAGLPISRRSSERDVDGSKKRATSAGGLDRDPPEDFRMSTSMYEVFHWHTPSPSTGSRPAQDDADSNNVQTPIGYNNRVARRRTDLMPTIPSPRGTSVQHTKPFTRSPGRAYSMTRLDQLAQPRQRRVPTPELDVVMEHRPVSMTRSYPSKKSDVVDTSNQLSRSMSHLAGSKPLRKSDTSTSMSHLNFSRPMVTPRMNKTERMRRQRLLNANNTDNLAPGVRSGEATPSRPGSAMSGTSSVASGVTMRRPTSAVHTPPRKPRPASIAGTGLSSDYTKKNSISNNDVKNVGSDHSKPPIPHSSTKSFSGKVDRIPSKSNLGLKGTSSARNSAKTTPLQSPTTENVGLIGDHHKSIPNTPKRKGSRQESSSTNQQQPITNGDHHQTNKTPAKQKSKNVTDKDNNNKTDKVNPPESVKAEVVEAQIDTTTTQVNQQEHVTSESVNETIVSESSSANVESNQVVDNLIDVDSDQQNLVDLVSETSTPNIMSVSQPPPQTQFDNLEQVDMSASMIAKIRITTEEEAKAALAERRRLAREEAERQAELERQRLEEIARIQAEKERAEEEEQRRLEEETLRLAQQQREAEELRLRQAIEEAQRREEEERQRKIEEEKQKAEKEEQERKAREEAEKQRIELAAKLEKEEREREARRKRVEAIMSRTRGASANNSAIQSNNDSDNQQSQQNTQSGNNQSGGEENNIVRNGTTITQDKQQLTKQFNNDNNTNNVLREVQLQSGDHPMQTPIINTRQLSVDGEFNSVVEQPSLATSKVPLNGSNVVHIFEQHISSNANPASVDVLINEDTINSNKSVSESSQQQSVTTGGDLA